MANYTSTHTGQQIDNAVDAVANKQDKLVSGTNIKTINNYSLLGSGNIDISGSGGITEISTQYVRITDLESGVYKLTYNGTKYLYYDGTSSTSTHTVTGGAGAVVLVVSKYSTTYWHWWYINGTTGYATLYYGYTYSSGGSTGSKSINNLYIGTPPTPTYNQLYHSSSGYNNNSGYTVYAYQLLVFNGAGLAAFTSADSSTSTTKIQLSPKYYPNAPIFYYGSYESVNTNSKFSGSSLYTVYGSVNLRFSFNISTDTLSTYQPVYIKMAINSDGSLSPQYSTSGGLVHPLVQTLPNSEDGYVYVFLGMTGSLSYVLSLEPIHPCFWYKNGKILPYSESSGGTSSNYYPIRSYTSGLQISSYSGSTNCQLYVPYATSSQYGAVKPGTGLTSSSGTLNVSSLPILTTAPTSANSDGVKIVYLESEPATKYSGYIYLIKSGS